ncbi:hypothetical protein [Polaribacter sp.]|uniref:hypothetical protein n=1 Tax=Polaribacter sp. TaxID=1920175 RepID=UPI003EF56EB4
MEDYIWYKVLYYWCVTKEPVGSGLTIPFLIGVEKEFGRGEDYKIHDLLSEFHSIEGDYSITIRNCQNINMDVCCLDILNSQEKEYFENFGSIFLQVDDYSDLDSFDDFKKAVSSEYIHYIREGNYSINNAQWSGFTDFDLDLINNIM